MNDLMMDQWLISFCKRTCTVYARVSGWDWFSSKEKWGYLHVVFWIWKCFSARSYFQFLQNHVLTMSTSDIRKAESEKSCYKKESNTNDAVFEECQKSGTHEVSHVKSRNDWSFDEMNLREHDVESSVSIIVLLTLSVSVIRGLTSTGIGSFVLRLDSQRHGPIATDLSLSQAVASRSNFETFSIFHHFLFFSGNSCVTH